MYEEDLPIEEYIYTEPLKERHYDTERFRALIALNDSNDEEAATELLFVSKRLFYNHHGLDQIMAARNTLLHFFDVETNDDIIPNSMNGGIAEHNELIETVLNALNDTEDLKKLNPKKLANRYPEVAFLSLVKIILMEIQEEAPKKIMQQLEDALSIYPDDLLLQLEKEALLNRQGKEGSLIKRKLLEEHTAAHLFKRSMLHSFELMSLHTALFEYLVTQKDLLHLDAFIFATQTLYPEWTETWSDKELYSEIMKVEFCKMIV
ncbi:MULTISPECIES: hypothetical protein [unclassified Carboxylicivirga]|uniref:hypothetical protein n=1 Tax=Carboxylicivirga TaxID=1628153 RepID=UPI003D33ED2F